jgi:hypothetical protein
MATEKEPDANDILQAGPEAVERYKQGFKVYSEDASEWQRTARSSINRHAKRNGTAGAHAYVLDAGGGEMFAKPVVIEGYDEKDGQRFARFKHPETDETAWWPADQLRFESELNEEREWAERTGIQLVVNNVQRDPTPRSSVLKQLRITGDELVGKQAPRRKWVMGGYIPQGEAGFLSAGGGTGKTTVAHQLAVSVVARLPDFYGRSLMHGPVVFLAFEDRQRDYHLRLEAIAEHYGITEPARLKDLHGFPLPEREALQNFDPALWIVDPRNKKLLIPTPLWDDLLEIIDEVRPVLVILDNRAMLYYGDDLDRAHATQVMFRYLRVAVCARFDTTVLLIDHPSQSGQKKGDGQFGVGGWHNSGRFSLFLDYIRDKVAGDEIIHDQLLRTLRKTKINSGRLGEEIQLK